MSIQVGTAGPLQRRYIGGQEVKKVYLGDKLIWSSGPPPDPSLRTMWPIPGDTKPVVVMFVGSSTTQGEIGTTREHQNYVNQLAARIVTHANNGLSTARVPKVTSGTVARPTTNGIWFWNCGLGGTISSNYIGTDRQSLMNSLQPDIMIHMIGANDYRNQNVPYATFKSNCQAVVNDARTRVPGVKHVFIHSYVPLDVTGNPTYRWEGYETALYELEAANSDVITITVRPEFEAQGVVLNGTDPNDLIGTDNIHALPAGYKMLANLCADKLQLQRRHNQPIFRMDANQLTAYANGAEVTSAPPPADVMEQTAGGAGQTAGQRPTMITAAINGNRALSFDGVDDTLDTNFVRSYGLPVTKFMVLKVAGGSASKPLFSRTTLNHNGYVWAFADSSTPYKVYYPSNSPTGNSFVYLDPNRWVIMAVVYTATDDQIMYMNSLEGAPSYSTGTDPDTQNGPFITSMRYGANTGRNTFAQMQVAYGELVQGELSPTEVAERMNNLAARFAVTLDPTAPVPPPPPPRTYLRDIGTQSYANTFQTGANRDLTADGWVDRSYSTGTYQLSDYAGGNVNNSPRRLIPSGVGSYRAYNCYYWNTQLSSGAMWARVKIYKPPAAADPNGGIGLVLRHSTTAGHFLKVMTNGDWRISYGTSNASTTAESPIRASGTIGRELVPGDELVALVTASNDYHFYVNDAKLGTVNNSTGSTNRYAGVLISQNDAGELYDFKCGVMGSDVPP
ncbi:minor tail protein [Gordonia phage RedWattleHog]|nr:minor tail protein [Gordonia phage RedWattleHog]